MARRIRDVQAPFRSTAGGAQPGQTGRTDEKELPIGYAGNGFDTSFDTGGVQRLYVRAVDYEGNVSGVYADSVSVRRGEPRILSIVADTAVTALFVNDEREFTVTAVDVNGTIRAVTASWDGDEVVDSTITLSGPDKKRDTATYGGLKRKYTFLKAQSGDMRWRVLFRDTRGTVSASDPNSFTIP